ncbi:MAG TPA: bifunctional nuclease family protein [Longilinea sp.]|nr:bifunctional nuclease family protein [Longilinea sp.]
MSHMVEVVIDSVRVSLTNTQRVVVLRESKGERYLPVWIGPYEAEAITVALQEIEVARPQTHDLIKNVLRAVDARLVRVEITALREDVFYGNLVVEIDNRQVDVDSRPSDALAVAVRYHVPILVEEDVLEEAGITPEKDIQSQEPESDDTAAKPAAAKPGEEKPASDDRLSVFKDFIDNLPLDDLDKPTGAEGEPDESDPDRDKN